MSETDFGDIRPYTDEEAVEALARVSRHPMIPIISKYLFPDLPIGTLSKMLRKFNSIDQFQDEVMSAVIESILDQTSEGFTATGTENFKKNGRKTFLAVSNHRDIVLDPALVQYALLHSGCPFSEICVGSNLLSNKLIEDLMRSNRMIKVIRGIGARELYLSSQRLSAYIRESVTTGRSPVWIAQREGRTKDGNDTTEQGLLKMFDMSGKGSFEENFHELNIIPLSISYEFEPCDARKAREVLLRRQGPYVKKKKEDLHSILTGIRQQKGHIHLEVGEPLSAEEIAKAAACNGNDRYQAIRHTLDNRIISGYKLWPSNYIAHDLLSGTDEYAKFYCPEQKQGFIQYMNHKLLKVSRGVDKDELQKVFLGIYANPIDRKKEIAGE